MIFKLFFFPTTVQLSTTSTSHLRNRPCAETPNACGHDSSAAVGCRELTQQLGEVLGWIMHTNHVTPVACQCEQQYCTYRGLWWGWADGPADRHSVTAHSSVLGSLLTHPPEDRQQYVPSGTQQHTTMLPGIWLLLSRANQAQLEKTFLL